MIVLAGLLETVQQAQRTKPDVIISFCFSPFAVFWLNSTTPERERCDLPFYLWTRQGFRPAAVYLMFQISLVLMLCVREISKIQ
jgi:hypothetical protein